MKKKNVCITGATRGIGFSIATRLARENYSVFVTGTSKESAENAALNIRGLVGVEDVVALELDLRDSESIRRAIEFVSLRDGLYALVNNAAICQTQPVSGIDALHVADVLQVNFEGALQFTGGLLASGLISRPGRIVSIASQLGVVTRPGYAAYCASKAALLSFSRSLAAEWTREGITANAILPCWVDSGITDVDLTRLAKEKGKDPAYFRRELEQRLYHGRLVLPEEVASVVSHLLSPDMSGVTAAEIPVGGPYM